MLKKYLLTFILFTSSALSENIVDDTKVNNNDTSAFILKFKLAIDHFKKKNFEDAYILLNQLFEKKADDLNINFYLGRSAYEIRKYHEAIVSYERFLFTEPNNNRVKLEMARSFFMANIIKESKRLFLEVKNDSKIPTVTSQIVDSYLKAIDEKESKHFVNGILMAGVIYDSNINNRSEHDTFNIYFANQYFDVTNTTEDVTNWYNQEVAIVNYKYKLNNNKVIKQDVMVYNKDSFNSKYDNTNVRLFTYSPALSVKYTNKLTIDYALYADRLKYAGKDKLKTFALIPKFNYIYNSKNKFTGYLKYQKKSDLQDELKDSKVAEFNTNFIHAINKDFSINTNLTFTKERAKDSTQSSIDYLKSKAILSLNYKMKQNLIFTPSFTYSVKKYKDYDNIFLNRTKNKQFKIGLSTTYIYSPRWIIQGSINSTSQNSNIKTNEYKKNTFGLNLIRTF